MIIRNIASYLVCMVIPLTIILMVIVHRITAKELSNEDADNRVVYGLLGSVSFAVISILFALLIMAVNGKAWIPFLQIFCGLILVVLAFRLLWVRHRQIMKESVIYVLGRVESLTIRLPGYFFLFGSFSVLMLLLTETPNSFKGFAQLTFLGGAGLYWYVLGSGNVYLTRRGIFRTQEGLICWQDIKSYEWGGDLRNTLIFHRVKGGKVWFRLKILQEEQVNLILSQFLSTNTTTNSETVDTTY